VNDIPSEDDEQVLFVTWLDKRNLLYCAVPNQGRRDFVYACKLKRMGVKAGIQDVLIFEPRGQYHGCAVELKRKKGGVVSEHQSYWQEALTKKGWLAVICKGADEAIAIMEKYLNDQSNINNSG
jgi:hypothetical protein